MLMRRNLGPPVPNLMLQGLHRSVYARFAPHLESVSLAAGHVIAEPGAVVAHAYFVNSGMISVLATLRDGNTLEVGVIGREGMADINLLLGSATTLNRVVVQVDATALRMDARVLLRLYNEAGPQMRAAGQRYVHYRIAQLSQSAICNNAHGIEERLARWLLTTADAVAADHFTLTHEFLSQMLGARRSSVTLAAGVLSLAGVIEYRRGRITILQRAKLEELACECYEIVRAELR